VSSASRVPTGRIDEAVSVAVDWTAQVPLLVITTLRRSPADVSEHAFLPVHVTTLQAQYGPLLLERIREALTPPTTTRPEPAT
jgi:hypothetical protein